MTSIFSRIDRFIILLEENLSKISRGKNVTILIHIFLKRKISLKTSKGKNVNALTSMNCVHDRETQLHLLDHAYTARMDDCFEDLLTLSEKKRGENVNILIHIF